MFSAPSLVDDVIGINVPFGTITKNSEVFDAGPSGVLGIQPSLGPIVEVTTTM